MNRTLLIAVAILIVLGAVYAVFRNDPAATVDELPDSQPIEQSVDEQATYSDSELGIAFIYPAGADGYVVEERLPSAPDGELMRTIVLMRSEDVGTAPQGGEGAPTITIQVARNPQQQQPQAWADTHHQLSTINLKIGDVAATVISGVNAIRYRADGLYASDNVVVAHEDKIYVISGMYIDEDSDIRRDYQPLLDTIRFI